MFRWIRAASVPSLEETMPKSPFFRAPAELTEKDLTFTKLHQSFHANIKMIVTTDLHDLSSDDLMYVMHKWVSQYSGPYLLGKLIKTMVVVLISNLQRAVNGHEVKFGTHFDHVVTFTFARQQSIPVQYLDYHHSDRFTYRSGMIFLSIQAEFNPVDSPGVTIYELYQEVKAYQFFKMDLKAVLAQMKVPIQDGDEKCIVFC